MQHELKKQNSNKKLQHLDFLMYRLSSLHRKFDVSVIGVGIITVKYRLVKICRLQHLLFFWPRAATGLGNFCIAFICIFIPAMAEAFLKWGGLKAITRFSSPSTHSTCSHVTSPINFGFRPTVLVSASQLNF